MSTSPGAHAGYSRHGFACIQMAAVLINTGVVQVRFAHIQVVSAWSPFWAIRTSKHIVLLIYTA